MIAGIVAELTALEPGRLMTWRQVNEGTFVTTEGRYELKAVQGGTSLTVSASLVGRGPARLFAGLFTFYLQRWVAPHQLARLTAAVAIVCHRPQGVAGFGWGWPST